LLSAHFIRLRSKQKTSRVKTVVVVVCAADNEYSSEATMPLIAAELEKNYGIA